MKCPFCGGHEDRVIDSRASGDGEATRRRRECRGCGRRYTTYERVEEVPRLVKKKDGRSEPFDRPKIMKGLLRACQKRSVPLAHLEAVVDRLERKINENFDYEVESRFIGEVLMEALKETDQVAYVRFASVYREFADVTEFIRELHELTHAGSGADDGIPAEGRPNDAEREPIVESRGRRADGLRSGETGRESNATRTQDASPSILSARSMGEAETGDRHQASTDAR